MSRVTRYGGVHTLIQTRYNFPLSIHRKHYAVLVNSKLIVERYGEGHEVYFMRCLKIDYSVRSHYSDINKLIMEVCRSALH